ncbi:MAG: 6-phosphogluconolactonase, partial [Rhodoluna sp.]|nr:6-phosphogluconolactonase [Rhodoluna sp.]
MRPIVNRFTDADAVASGAAQAVVARLNELLAEKDKVNLVVTGGTVGILTLAKLRDLSMDWSNVHIWWGDERFVEKNSADRNELQAKNALLDHIAIPVENLHPFPASDEGMTLDEAAEAFRSEVAGIEFDVLLLGIGPDGHIASLFPGKNAQGELVVAEHDSPKPPPQRLSLSYAAINSASEVWFTVAGADKDAAV